MKLHRKSLLITTVTFKGLYLIQSYHYCRIFSIFTSFVYFFNDLDALSYNRICPSNLPKITSSRTWWCRTKIPDTPETKARGYPWLSWVIKWVQRQPRKLSVVLSQDKKKGCWPSTLAKHLFWPLPGKRRILFHVFVEYIVWQLFPSQSTIWYQYMLLTTQ